jgi:uncharacterized Zn finger protein
MAEVDESERHTWAETLDELSESLFGGASLLIAVTAAEHGWEYPPLQAAMAGNITEQGAWEGDAPDFADALAKIRLGILERRGEYKAYLNLAQAEGQFMAYLHMLAKQGESDLAISEARAHLTQPGDLHALARTLAEVGEQAKAIQVAKDGLTLGRGDGQEEGYQEKIDKAALAAWLRDLANTEGETALALWAARQALLHNVCIENYQAVHQLAGSSWPTLKVELLSEIARSDVTDGKVDIYLHEGMHTEAIATVDGADWFFHIDKVIEGVKKSHPEWAFRQCKKQADAIMNAGRAKDYDVAAEWVRRGRDILLAAGLDKLWHDTLEQLMEVHARKYKLMPMLRALA